jgi:putative aminopeptidase FrvX
MNVRRCKLLSFLAVCALQVVPSARAQSLEKDLAWLAETPAVSGYEQELAAQIRDRLKSFSPRTDNLGNVYVTLGTGAPHRLIATSIDEPGYVVSAITPDGFLRVQRLPQQPPNAVFDLLHAAQPVWVLTRSGKKVSGVFAGLSVHLQPGRQNAPKMNHPDEMYVDIGAASADEVRAAGVDLLDPVALNRELRALGANELSTPAVGDRFGSAVLLELLRRMDASKLKGTLTVAFATQQWTGGRGFGRLLNELHPDEVVFVGRIGAPRQPTVVGQPAPSAKAAEPKTGSGVLLAVKDLAAPFAALPGELKDLAQHNSIPLTTAAAAPLRSGGVEPLPERTAQLGIANVWPVTPAESLARTDLKTLADLLEAYASGSVSKREHTGSESFERSGRQTVRSTISSLIETYGASGHEAAVRKEITRLLPSWAKRKLETDSAGNLVLHLAIPPNNPKAPKLAFVAHMDEIGYQVRWIEPDGRLLVDVLGGGFSEYFLGHPVIVHTAKGRLGGVLELPSGWDQQGFEWPRGPRAADEPAHVYVGTHSAEETLKLGVQTGDWVTIPKEYRPLLGTRANGRSFDDRVGCAALIEAVKALSPPAGRQGRQGPVLPGRDITFIWSTEEEVGLRGAAAAAERMAKDAGAPDFVFAVDTFVSSDSPLELKRFADAEVGKGFVVRSVDNSNITPRELVDRVVRLARQNKIPVQYGVTGGGNDGSAFLRYGSVDIPLAWPLRYSHSPGEVIDTRDLDALAKIIAVLAKSW